MRPYIKKLEIRNYKTHRNTRMLFGDGVNSIVGPNGVGKSNILESIIFGLGERSPKNLRVSSFSEIVYNNRKDLDVSVSLVIVDGNGEEHKFRRIYDPEKGEHKYKYNGRRTSRTSYIMNLMKLGGKGFKYIYIQQGDILNRANATPQDIREIVDEALGIKQYEEKKKAASKKLEEADIKLRTLEGKYSEVQRFIREYLREMISYHTLENIDNIERLLKSAQATKRKDEVLEELEKVGLKRQKIKKKIMLIDSKIDLINNRLADIRKKLEIIENGIDRLEKDEYRSLFRKKDEERERRDEVIRKLIEESSEIKRFNHVIDDKKREIDSIKKSVIESNKELKDRLKILKMLEKERREIEREIEYKDNKLSTLKEKIKEINERWREELDRINKSLEEKARLMAEALVRELIEEDLKREIETTKKRLDRIENITNILKRRYTDIDSKLNSLKKAIRKNKKRVLEIKRESQKRGREVSDAERLLKKLDRIIESMKKDKNITRSYYLASKRVFETAKALRIAGCIGILGELVKGPNEIISILREANPLLWFGIIVKDHREAEEILRISRELGKNISVLVLTEYRDKEIHDKSVLHVLKYPKKIEPILKELFGDILLLSSDEEILETISRGFSVVHMTGDYIIGKGIWFRTKRTKIHIPKNLERIREVKEKFAKIIERRKVEMKKMRNQYEKLKEKYMENISKLTLLTRNRKLLKTQIKYFDEWRNDLLIKLNELSERKRKSVKGSTEYKSNIGKIKRELAKLEEKEKSLTQDISMLKIRLEDITSRQQEINNLISSSRALNQERKNKIDSLRNDIKHLRQEGEATKKRIKEIAIQLREINNRLRQLDEKEKELEKKITNLKEKRDKLKIKYSKGTELEKKYDDRRRAYERILINLDYKFKELQRRLTELNTLIEDLGVGEKRIKRIEDINEILTYLEKEKEELEEASKYSETRYYTHIESYKMYSIRRNELLKERESILKFIDEIDKEKERVFLDGFNKIRERFSTMFKEVFPDSRAYIEMLEPDNIDSDIQIYVEFKDKPRLPLSALSGGEKTAIIILFLLSVYSIKEDTVFLLDEIDAHLDVKNVENVAKVIRSQRKYSQIILVTLPGHDSMVTIADYVIPVVFKKGVSRVFQMEREHLERMIGR